MRGRGWPWVVAVPAGRGNGADRLRDAGITVAEIPLRRVRKTLNPATQAEFIASIPRDVTSIRQLIRTHNAEVVQICGLLHFHGSIAARLEDVPLVWQFNSTLAPMWLRRVYMPYISRVSDVVMTHGHKVADGHPGVREMGDRWVSFPTPVDLEKFRPDPQARAEARRRMGVPDGSLVLGTVGNRGRQKAHEFFVRAFARLREKHPDLLCRIVGGEVESNSAYYEREVVGLSRERGLLDNDAIRFIDPGSKVHEYLPGFDVFVLTSLSEGMPLVIGEAMACEIPVVGHAVGGVPEIVTHGRTGYVVPPGDTEALVNTLDSLLRDPQTRSRLGAFGRTTALSQYSPDACASAHVEAYRRACERHDQRAGQRRGF